MDQVQWTIPSPPKSSFINYSQSECEVIALNELTSIKKIVPPHSLVIVNEKLNWNEHIEVTCSKIIQYCYGLLKTRTTLNISTLKAMSHVYIYPHLKYGTICWGNSKKTSDIFKMQRAIRNIVGAKKMDSCKPCFKTLEFFFFVTRAVQLSP